MNIFMNEVSEAVVNYFTLSYKEELDDMYYGHIHVFEDDADTNEYIMTTNDYFYDSVRFDHKTFEGQSYIVLVVDPMD